MDLGDIDWDTWTPKDRCTLLFVVEPERILLIEKQRGFGVGKINGPGGKIDPGETPLEAAVREVEEELCITPQDPVELGELRFEFVSGYSIHCHVFRSHAYTGTPTATEEAVPVWYPRDAIPYEKMWADDIRWLPLFLEGKRFDGRFIFDEDTMLDHTVTTPDG